MTDRVLVFDTTLRDGEQSPGASMTISEKLMLAEQLERLRVDVIEAGFPISSDGDFESVRSIAETDSDHHDRRIGKGQQGGYRSLLGGGPRLRQSREFTYS